jgi:Enoyl-(Acyl carrier protein) reductase
MRRDSRQCPRSIAGGSFVPRRHAVYSWCSNLDVTWPAVDQHRCVSSPGIPLGRIGAPEDIANAVVYLCLQGAAFINGQNLAVDGGYRSTEIGGASETSRHDFGCTSRVSVYAVASINKGNNGNARTCHSTVVLHLVLLLDFETMNPPDGSETEGTLPMKKARPTDSLLRDISCEAHGVVATPIELSSPTRDKSRRVTAGSSPWLPLPHHTPSKFLECQLMS